MGVVIPDQSPSAAPVIPILINPKWLPIVIGLCVDNLLLRTYWQGTEGEIDDAIDYADELIYILSASVEEVSFLGLVSSTWQLESATGRFEAYDSANLLASFNPTAPDTLVPLKFSGSGGVTTIDNAGANNRVVGDNSGDQWVAQSFIPDHAGILYEILVRMSGNTGSPTGAIIWEIRTNASGNPSTNILISGSFAPVPSTTNVISIPMGIPLGTGNTYWFILRCETAQASGVRYNVQSNNAAPYANGVIKRTLNGGGSWISDTGDLRMSIETVSVSTRDKLAQAFQTDTTGDLELVRLWIRKHGSPTGTLTLKLYSDDNGEPDSLLSTSDTMAAATLGAAFALESLTFSTPYSLAADTRYWLVFETTDSASSSNWIEWQALSTS